MPSRLRGLPWGSIATGAVLVLALSGAAAASFARALLVPYWARPEPMPVGGTYSRFTLMVMSYDARLPSLQFFVRHYSQCPSVGELFWGVGGGGERRIIMWQSAGRAVRVPHAAAAPPTTCRRRGPCRRCLSLPSPPCAPQP